MKNYILLVFAALTLAFLQSCKGEEDITKETKVDLDDDNTTAIITEGYTYQLPVIFHVFYQNAANKNEYIDAARLRTLLSRVNELYQGSIYGESENINVRFIAATHDEQGHKLTTPGVEYIHYDGTFPIDQLKFISSEDNRKYLWDLNDYINVMVFPFAQASDSGESTVMGITSLPLMRDDEHAVEGLQKVKSGSKKLTKANLKYTHCSCLNSNYVYEESTRYGANKGRGGYTYNVADANVTLAHELGHYLGLSHVFTEDKTGMIDACGDTDYCEDTPSYNRVEYEQQLKFLIGGSRATLNAEDLAKRQSCKGDNYVSANIMDYMVTLSYKLSADQKKRMRHVLYYGLLMPGPKKNNVTRSALPADDVVVEQGTYVY